MSHLLVIHSSPNPGRSITRQLTQSYVARWPGTVTTRDLAADPVPHLGADLLAGLGATPADRGPAQAAAVARADQIIAEVEQADVIALGIPMYNFSVPSTVKAWIDHLLRAGRTFRYTAEGPEGLLSGKKVLLFVARGGIYGEGPGKAADFQEPYLRQVLGFIGLTDVTVIAAEGIAYGPDQAEAAIAAAHTAIGQLAA